MGLWVIANYKQLLIDPASVEMRDFPFNFEP